jgi:acetyltransferase-like isoleucine patch superfamily enzyme
VKEAVRKLMRLPLVTLPFRLIMAALDASLRVISVLKTAVLFPQAEELPHCHWTVTVKKPENIKLGRGVVIGTKCSLGGAGGIVLGDHVRLSEGVMIETAGLDFTVPPPYPHVTKPVIIEDSVWIGARAVILAGVTIGARSIIGAGAVVSRSVAPDSVVSGMGVKEWPREAGRTYRADT